MPIRKNPPEVDLVRDRLVQSFEELRYRKLVRTKAEFCKNIGLVTSSNLSRMVQMRLESTIKNVLLLHKVYGVSLEWIMLGKGNVLEKENK